MPQIELMNLCEHLFLGSCNTVMAAYWTDASAASINMSDMTIKKTSVDDLIETQKKKSGYQIDKFIDITHEIREAFTSYFAVYGTKIIDFNTDTSAFRELKDLVG